MATESTEQHSYDSRNKKRMKLDDSTTTLMKNNVFGVKKNAKRVFASSDHALVDDDLKKIMKERNDRNDRNDQKRSKVFTAAEKDSRTRTPSSPLVKEEKKMMMEQCKKRREVFVAAAAEKDSRTPSFLVKEEKMMMMDHCKKNQCWVIVKRMIVGKDGWALKKSLDLKVLNNYEQIKEEFKRTVMRTIGLEDIEAKLNKFLYSVPDEFADDMRLVFSRAFLYHPKSQIHKIAIRLSESFENNWKSLKEKWTLEDRKRKRIQK